MKPSSSSELPADSRSVAFSATHWSVVLAACDENPDAAQKALERLCETYWYPLYAYTRRCGHSPEDAQDLTQAFFAQLISRNWVARADPHKGRFRSFLLMVMKRFLAKEWEKANTLKRGGCVSFVPLEMRDAEARYAQELADTSTPEQIFEKQWALTLLESVLKHLREDYSRDGKATLFSALEPCLIGSGEAQPYAELAAKLGMTEGAVKVAVCRLRERYRVCLKEEIAQTIASPAEAGEELRHLFRVLAR